MKIGIILPIGRTDKYGYQYDDFTELILNSQEKFADHILVLSTSRYINKELFENHTKIELISNKNTWFKLMNGKEIFKPSSSFIEYGIKKLIEEGIDVAIQIHINQYIPKSSIQGLKKSCKKMLDKNKPFNWLYKSYQCGNLLFNADRRLPWIFNLTEDLEWRTIPDGIIHRKTKKIIYVQEGNYKKYNNQAIRDLPWECTIEDIKEKSEFIKKGYKNIEYVNNPLKIENKYNFNKKKWILNMQKQINMKKLSKLEFDEFEKQILKTQKNTFLSNIFERNYCHYSRIKRNYYLFRKKYLKEINKRLKKIRIMIHPFIKKLGKINK